MDHSSMDKYFRDICKPDPTRRDLMKYEWARYESLRDFPKTSPMMPMRLAQAGFYYNGLGEEVICFCCEIRNRNWNSEETAVHVHKRISPTCSFIRGEPNGNVSIHGSDLESTEHAPNDITANYIRQYGASGGLNDKICQVGASGGPNDTSHCGASVGANGKCHCGTCGSSSYIHTEDQISFPKSTLKPSKYTESETSETRENASQNIAAKVRNTAPTVCGEDIKCACTTSAGTAQRAIKCNTISTANGMQFQNKTTCSSGINNDRAKHPDYATKAARTSSYTGWSSRHIITPEELADAGFYYAGFQDCVRCYFCGGGLKNWVYGDSPWIEHARWYPSCAFLRQSKGDEYIRMYSELETEHEEIEEIGNIEEQSTTNLENEESDAARRVIEMGYGEETVHNAIHKYKATHVNTTLTAEALLEIILDDDQAVTFQGNASNLNTESESNNAPVQKNNVSEVMQIPSGSAASSCSQSSLKVSQTADESTLSGLGAATIGDVKSLAEENRSLREQMMCKICMDKDACIVFLPCGHMVACPECAPALRKCAICRKLIKGTIRVYPS